MAEAAESSCRSCGAPIDFGITSKGKRMPLDRGTVEGGNVRIVGTFRDGTPAVEVTKADETGTRRTHFASCPNADRHRQDRKRR